MMIVMMLPAEMGLRMRMRMRMRMGMMMMMRWPGQVNCSSSSSSSSKDSGLRALIPLLSNHFTSLCMRDTDNGPLMDVLQLHCH
uniref:HDC18596 n=1 Tax=Drosophila melanogaster TaxID=7227 RepID=Q6IID9_DROME|nr:TPA_inf: HDC18596 [Drosophila melanogaster]